MQNKVWVLNGEVQLDEYGTPIQSCDSPYIWLGDICAARPDLFQPENATGQHLIADFSKRTSVTLPLNEEAAAKLIDILDRYYMCTTFLQHCWFLAGCCSLRGSH